MNLMNGTMNSRALLIVGLASTLLCGCESALSEEGVVDKKTDVMLEDELDRASYLLGYEQSKSLQEQTQGILNLDAYTAGVSDFSANADSKVSVEEQQMLMAALNAAVGAKQNEASAIVVAQGEALLAENGAKTGVTTLASGLQYEVLTAGEGAKPAPEDTVVTHYHGTLPDGTVFDSSVDRGQPASFRVDRVIAGWTEALQLMSIGSKWRLVIPSDLAYGERGTGSSIPPNATLVFEVELLDIK